MELFIPNNLVMNKDGSVSPKDFTKEIVPFENETLTEFYKRYEKETANLKPYEKGMWIPYNQQKELYNIIITEIPSNMTQKEEDECLQPRIIYDKFFLDKDVALKYGKNKIKQQSIACYYRKTNTNNRSYTYYCTLLRGAEDPIVFSAKNGKLV